jgi:hypothetical protein
MSSMASVLLVTSSNQIKPVYSMVNQGSPVQLAQSVKSIGSALQTGNLSAAQKALASTQQNLPMGLLLSVSEPSGNNSQANTDYQAMRNALVSGNLTAAQQAYIRLQSDLEITRSNPATDKKNVNGFSAGTSPTSTSSQPSPANSSAATSSGVNPPGSILNVTA